MKVCVFGAGAIGSNIAARLIAARAAEVSLVARGAHLAAIRQRGLTLRTGSGEEFSGQPVAATDDPATLPRQDLVVVTLKAHAIPAQADAIASLLAPGAAAVFAINGIPWWWRYGLPGGGTPGALPLLDPGGALWSRLGAQRALGCVINSSNELVEPGVVLNSHLNDWLLGEPDGSHSERLRVVVALFASAGMHATVSPDLRRDILWKLALNLSNSPISALTRLRVNAANLDPDLRALKASLMQEAMALTAALGWDMGEKIDMAKILAPRDSGPGARPSMLQDALAGRPMEVEALLGQPQALAREAGVPTPVLDVIVALARGLDRSLRPAGSS